MDRRSLWWLTTSLLVGSAGCEGCLDLDEYQLVPPGFDVSGGGGFGAGISVGGGGAGGMSAGCDVDAGEIYVSVPIDSASGIGPCDDPLVAGARIYALDVVDGSCLAWGSVAAEGATDVQMRVRVSHREDGIAHVVGAYGSGDVTFPDRCTDGSSVALTDPTPQRGLFVARLERQGSGFCTAWARLATAPGLPFSPTALEVDGSGSVAVAGALGGQTATFSSGAGGEEVSGSVFFAHYRVDGTLDELRGFAGGIGDDIKGIEAVAGDWLVAGALRQEDPACHGCSGEIFVTDPASSCAGQGGIGGAGGAGPGGAGGSGGVGGLGGAGGAMATPNAINATLWRWNGPGDACQALASYGADGDDTDAQAAYDVDATFTAGVCTTLISGQAGRAAWRLGESPATALFDAGGVSRDGFVAQLTGADCGPGGQLDWATRLTASAGSTWGNRLRARRCGAGSVVTAYVADAAGGELTAHRCTPDGACDSDDVVALGDGNRLVALGLDDDGELRWHGSFGPVDAGLQAIAGTELGELRDHLAADNRDRVTLVVDAIGPLEATNVEVGDCPILAVNPGAGRYVIGLDPQGGTNGEAKCNFVVGLP